MQAIATASAVAFPHLLPTTAIGWLKAIGLLRLSAAKGYWRNDCFYLEIESVEALVEDILTNYQPKPFASPWNGSSIFDDKHQAKKLEPVLKSQSQRYAAMRTGYRQINAALQNVDKSGSSADKKKKMIPQLQQVDNEYFQEWLRSVGLLNSKDEFKSNELLGAGGIIGNKDFCTDYLKVCTDLWDLETGAPSANTAAYIRASVVGEAINSTLVEAALLGHTHPAADYFGDLAPSDKAEDYLGNRTSSQWANPIDLVFYLEGTATLTGKALSLNEIEHEADQEHTIVAYPLLLEVNSGSADTSDRTGRKNEVWLPLWDKPLGSNRFQKLVDSYLSFRIKNQIIDTLDLLNEMGKVSSSLGIKRFSRFGLWTRKGTKSDYLVHIGIATPGGADIGAELRLWRLRAKPENLRSEYRAQYNLLTAIQKSLYRLQQGNAEAIQAIRLLGQLEQLHSRIQPSIPPVSQLTKEWIEAVYKELPIFEVELAAALVSAVPKHFKTGYSCVYSFRQLLSSAQKTKDKDTYFWSKNYTHQLKTVSLEAFCLSLLKLWNLIWEQGIKGKDQRKYHPSFGRHRASPDAIAAFIAGRTDDQLILELTLGFALCDLPQKLAPYSNRSPLPEPYKYAAAIQWNRDTMLTAQTINGLIAGSTVPLQRQLAALPRPILPTDIAPGLAEEQRNQFATLRKQVVLPDSIAIGKRCALALVFPCKPFYTFGETHAQRDHS